MPLRDTTQRVRELFATLRSEGVPEHEIATASLVSLQERHIREWMERNKTTIQGAARVAKAAAGIAQSLGEFAAIADEARASARRR